MIKHGGIFLGKGFFEKVFLWLGLILLLCSGFYFCMFMEPVPLVIFAGGGSVKNYINNEYKIKLDSAESVGIPKSIYINLPSEYGWALLKEEIDRFKMKPAHRPFLYICLSADSITEDDTKKIGFSDDHINHARIYGYHIGDDELMVYDNSTCIRDTISVSSLKKEIVLSCNTESENNKKLYVTSRKSGTLRKYQEILCVNFDNIRNTLYYETDSLDGAQVAYVLGSRFYKPKIKNSKWLYVVDNKGDTIKKPLYVYFVVFEKDGFIPNKQIVYFFEESLKINILDTIKNRKSENGLIIHLN